VRLLSAPTLAKTLVRYPSEFRRVKSRGCKISLVAKRSTCPSDLLPKPGKLNFKQLIQSTPLNLVLLRSMSVSAPDSMTDQDCERGRVTQRPPISYAQFKYTKWVTEPDTVKVKLPTGDQYVCDLMHDASNAETYLKWYQTYLRVLDMQKLCIPLDVATQGFKKLQEDVKKLLKTPKRETPEEKVTRENKLSIAKLELVEAAAAHATAIQAYYDLFRKLLADDPLSQWDRIVKEVHDLDPWTSLTGQKKAGLRMKTAESFEDCITFHKRTVFSLDAAERQKNYMMGSLKKPHKMTIKGHVSRCETMNGYISLLPTLRDSSLAVTSTEKGNVPFNSATLAGIVLATCHIDWRNLYELNHTTVPESTRSMLHDLENIEKIFVEKNNEKAKANAAKAGTAPQKGASVPRKKGKRGGDSGGPPPKRARTAKHCKHCKAASGPYQTHNTIDCRRFDKDGKEIGKPWKPSDPAKKPWKKGGGDSGQMAYLTEKLEKLEKKLKKSKKASKKRSRDSSSDSSDSE